MTKISEKKRPVCRCNPRKQITLSNIRLVHEHPNHNENDPCDQKPCECNALAETSGKIPENDYHSLDRWHEHNQQLLRRSARGYQKLNV